MGQLVTRRWEGDPGAPGGRRSRRTFDYEAFVPDRIADLDISLPGETAQVTTEAEDAIRSLNRGPASVGLEAIGPLLLRAESVASSRIEGLELSQRSLARALFDPKTARGTARQVAGNVRAMEQAIQIGAEEETVSVASVLAIHRTLLEATEDREIAGHLRTVQNWLGGRLNSPLDAEFIPPPPEEVPRLMQDLADFMDRDDMPAVTQAALAHAQFETIHPFVDGNGRVGRCLIHLILRRRGVAQLFVPPVSVVLATNAKAYIRGLTAFRDGRLDDWNRSFAISCASAATQSQLLALDIQELEAAWLERAGQPRRGSATRKVISVLAAQPIITVQTAQKQVGGSLESARLAMNRLEASRVIRRITVSWYDRVWAAEELFDLLNAFEHSLATPTRTGEPRRRAPRARPGG
jgi:Fic family protein